MVVVLSLVLNQAADSTPIAKTAAHQIIGLPRAVIAETTFPSDLSSQKNDVGLSMKGHVKGLDAYG